MKNTRLVRPADPARARGLADRARGSRAGTHGRARRRNRPAERRGYLAFERSAG